MAATTLDSAVTLLEVFATIIQAAAAAAYALILTAPKLLANL
jgi:hypothetical protein